MAAMDEDTDEGDEGNDDDEEEVQVLEERSSSATGSSGGRGGRQQQQQPARARAASGEDEEEAELEADGGVASWAMATCFPLGTPRGFSEYDHCRAAVKIYARRAYRLLREGKLQMNRAQGILYVIASRRSGFG